MKLTELFDNLYRPLRLRGKSPKTARLYGCTLRTFGRWLGRDAELKDLDELVFARYLEHRASVVSPYTAEKERSQLMALAGLAWERRLLETKPQCPPAPLPERIPTAWSVEDMERLMSHALNPNTYGCRSHAEHYARVIPALIAVAWDTGERIGAIMETREEDFQRPTLLVRAEARKGRKRDRMYQLTETACDLVVRSAAIGNGELFPWPFARTYLWSVFAKPKAAAGLDDGSKRQGFHQVRRTTLSHFCARGGDATWMADHASPNMTKRWYLDPRLTENGLKPCEVLPSIAGTRKPEAAPQLASSGEPKASTKPVVKIAAQQTLW